MTKLPESFESAIERRAHALRREEMLASVEDALKAILGLGSRRTHGAEAPRAARGPARARG